MKNKQRAKKAVKRLTAAAKGAAKKTRVLLKKAGKHAAVTTTALRKEWKKQQPQREQSIREFKRIGGDVIATIRKDMNEARTAGAKNKKK